MALSCSAQLPGQERWGYEYAFDIPVYIDSIQSRLTYPLAWRHVSDSMTMAEWQSAARKRVFDCMGPAPPRPSEWHYTVLASEHRDGYIAYRIELNLSTWYTAKAYVLVPDGRGPFPAVNLLHDHGAHLSIGKEKMIRPFAVDSAVISDAGQWCRQLYEGQFLGDYLARNGFVVFSMDAPLWGERGRKEGVDRKKYDIIAGNMMMLGQDLCAYMHYDDIASTDFLSTLPHVDASRIGAAGCSMGAYRAWTLAALSPRVKAACAICWMVTTDEQLTYRHNRHENGGFANAIPALRRWLDYPDIASLAAPRAVLFVSGRQDHLFPTEGVEKAFHIINNVWHDAGADGNVTTLLLDQKHECNRHDQQLILEFLKQHL